jgi:type II secretory pathway pseudopilin PulG
VRGRDGRRRGASATRRRTGSPQGVALLEVLVALTLLASAGVAAVALASESGAAIARARARDESVREASAFFDAVALWTRGDLDRRLGERPQGPWRLRIDRPTATLYVLVLSDSGSGAEVLRTALYRPEAPRAPR